ncbi:DUF3783 domain-containing protein [Oribacterium sp. WCC10]|uniref:DUF3783 domain-containing protein n=1 Tax=Oribacterium sp. WCC10 TaxID=1855343 RepID=UPI0008F04837|nr:DUF3783 domain-containing protein [Oribacterium sp. WCC10]SFG71945.1 protein of unknown function [Oribacterium sp. WCC10]
MKSMLYINKKDKSKETKVKSVAIFNRIKIESIDSEDLAELPEDAELLYMRGIDRIAMEKFLSDLKKKNIRINLKCVETVTNKDWSLYKLYEEIKREHERIQFNRDN